MKGVSDRCPKCGDRHIMVKWDEVFDELAHTCERCNFKWHTEPLTKRPAETQLESPDKDA